MSVCTTRGCGKPTQGGRCANCRDEADKSRGTARERGYDEDHANLFRAPVLKKNPLCVCTDTTHGHGSRCLKPSTIADHHPLGRDELIAAGLNPNDPEHGRGLCMGCHSSDTTQRQPGGWNRR